MNRYKLQKSILAITLTALSIFTNTASDFRAENTQSDTPQANNTTQQVLIQSTDADINIIPDKYNTGAKGELTTVEPGQMVNGVQFLERSEGTVNAMDFAYHNKEVSGTIVFENLDFSKCKVALYNGDLINREIKLIFNNCKFATVGFGRQEKMVSAEFNNCTFRNFYGSNAIFNYCSFGQSYSDGIVPFENITLNNCFISDMASEAVVGGEVHTDGTQIYGHADTEVKNITYDHCRFEIPALKKEESTAYVNACIMLQIEFNNADGVNITNCIVNGGGYSIYATSKYEEYTLKNVLFKNIQFGCTAKYGKFYPKTATSVAIEAITNTDSLYIGSVWKTEDTTHFSVTNDTSLERTLTIYTDKGSFDYTIPACPTSDLFDSSLTYDQMPFDMDIVVPYDCQYAVCVDTTNGYSKQIRFANWTGEDVYIDKETADVLLSRQEKVILSGECGKDVTFTLTNTGILTLSGTGSTYAYHSAKPVPWADYLDQVKVIRVEEGIEQLGGQIFRKCTGVLEVYLPDSLLSIGGRAFSNCSSLLTVTLPASIESVGDAVFASSLVRTVEYEGDDWSAVTVGSQNESWSSTIKGAVTETPQPSESLIPGTSTEPKNSAMPAESTVPANSSEPTNSSEPLKSDTPAKTATPDGTSTPKESLIPSQSSTPVESALPDDSYMKGDVNLDGEVTLADAQLTLKAALKIIALNNSETLAADTDDNDEITLADAQKILKVALKIDDFK